MCLVLLATGVGLALRIQSQLVIWCYALATCTFFSKGLFRLQPHLRFSFVVGTRQLRSQERGLETQFLCLMVIALRCFGIFYGPVFWSALRRRS